MFVLAGAGERLGEFELVCFFKGAVLKEVFLLGGQFVVFEGGGEE